MVVDVVEAESLGAGALAGGADRHLLRLEVLVEFGVLVLLDGGKGVAVGGSLIKFGGF